MVNNKSKVKVVQKCWNVPQKQKYPLHKSVGHAASDQVSAKHRYHGRDKDKSECIEQNQCIYRTPVISLNRVKGDKGCPYRKSILDSAEAHSAR